MSYPRASGAIRSTARDLCRWMSALMGGHVLQPENLKLMLTPARFRDGSLPPRYAGAPTGASGPRHGIGLSLEDVRGHREAWHQGGISGYFSELRNFPETDVHLAMLVNRDGLGGAPTNPVASAALDLLLPT
jgi:CubicO group peptidase (beta-lactamase class C family)